MIAPASGSDNGDRRCFDAPSPTVCSICEGEQFPLVDMSNDEDFPGLAVCLTCYESRSHVVVSSDQAGIWARAAVKTHARAYHETAAMIGRLRREIMDRLSNIRITIDTESIAKAVARQLKEESP